MSIVVTEDMDSRQWSGGNCTIRAHVRGTDDDSAAQEALLSSGVAPAVYASLVRDPHITLEPDWVDTDTADGCWRAEVTYKPGVWTWHEIGAQTITVDTGGGTQHITANKQTIHYYYAGGVPAFVDGAAINATREGVEGCDIVVPSLRFTVTRVFDLSDCPAYAVWHDLSGHVNDAIWTVTDTQKARSMTFQAGEALLLSVQEPPLREDGALEITHSFAGSPNRTNLTVEPITGIAKGGHHHLGVRYQDDTDHDHSVKKPIRVKISRVYDPGDFTQLKLV